MTLKSKISDAIKMADRTFEELMNCMYTASPVEGLVIMGLVDKAISLKAGIIGLKNSIELEVSRKK